MTTSRLLRVPEQGTAAISPQEWTELAASPAFWNLVDRGVVSVEPSSARVVLRGACYVGRARVSENIVLELHEKVPGSLASLLRFASGGDFKLAKVPAPASTLGPLIVVLIAQFVAVVRQYVSKGREFRYDSMPMRGALIGGRLDATQTILLRARGYRHLAAFRKNVLTFEHPVNQTVMEALREVEVIQKLIQLPAEVLEQLRAIAIVFQDCRGTVTSGGLRSDAVRRADKLATASSEQSRSDMLSLAAIILSHESFEADGIGARSAPRSWFLNLETMFERAVRVCLQKQMGAQGKVSSGRVAPQAIFPPSWEAYKANPDLVIRPAKVGSISVGDVKYKLVLRRAGGLPSASDIYQLLVHAAAFGATEAFLVFPAARFFIRTVGDSVTGARVRIFGLEIEKLDEQVRLILDE